MTESRRITSGIPEIKRKFSAYEKWLYHRENLGNITTVLLFGDMKSYVSLSVSQHRISLLVQHYITDF